MSLSRLISALINKNDYEQFHSLPDEDIKPTTIRLEPAIRHFCDAKAQSLGISVQSFISMVLQGVMIESTQPAKGELTLMYERFFQLFQEHNIPLGDIPIVLKQFGFKLSVLTDKDRLLDAYTPAIQNFLSREFHVNSSWLKGTSDGVYSPKEWYKQCRKFCLDITDLINNDKDITLFLVTDNEEFLSIPVFPNDSRSSEGACNILPFLRIRSSYDVDYKSSYTSFQMVETFDWTYWRSRYQFKAIMLFFYLLNKAPLGYTLHGENFRKLEILEQIPNKFCAQFSYGFNWDPTYYIDVHHNSGPFPGSQQIDEIQYVYNEFFNFGLDKILDNEIASDSITGRKVNKLFLENIITENAKANKMCLTNSI